MACSQPGLQLCSRLLKSWMGSRDGRVRQSGWDFWGGDRGVLGNCLLGAQPASSARTRSVRGVALPGGTGATSPRWPRWHLGAPDLYRLSSRTSRGDDPGDGHPGSLTGADLGRTLRRPVMDPAVCKRSSLCYFDSPLLHSVTLPGGQPIKAIHVTGSHRIVHSPTVCLLSHQGAQWSPFSRAMATETAQASDSQVPALGPV